MVLFGMGSRFYGLMSRQVRATTAHRLRASRKRRSLLLAPGSSLVSSADNFVAYARIYVGLGWPIFPVHSIKDGRCTCGNAECKQIGKHPRISGGLKNATTSIELIDHWGKRW